MDVPIAFVPFGALWYLQLLQQFGLIHDGFFSHSPTAAHTSQSECRSAEHAENVIKNHKSNLMIVLFL